MQKLLDAVRELLADIDEARMVRMDKKPNYFGHFDIFDTDANEEVAIEWPNLAITADKVRALLDAAAQPRVVVILDGGLVQDIIADTQVEVATLDADIEGATEDELTGGLPEWNGTTQFAAGIRWVEVAPEQVKATFAVLEAAGPSEAPNG